MREILKRIPGFRSDILWKKIIATIYYLIPIWMLFAGVGYFLFYISLPFILVSIINLIKCKSNGIPLSKGVISVVASLGICIIGLILIPNTDSKDIKTTSKLNEKPVQEIKKTKDKIEKEVKNVEMLTLSGGIGDTYQTMNKMQGKPKDFVTEIDEDGSGDMYFYKDIKVFSYIDFRAREIGIVKKENETWTEDQVAEIIKKHIPKDSKFIQSWDKDENTRVLYYKSNSLSQYFEDDWYEDVDGNVDRGTFIVLIMHNESEVNSISIGTGCMIEGKPTGN